MHIDVSMFFFPFNPPFLKILNCVRRYLQRQLKVVSKQKKKECVWPKKKKKIVHKMPILPCTIVFFFFWGTVRRENHPISHFNEVFWYINFLFVGDISVPWHDVTCDDGRTLPRWNLIIFTITYPDDDVKAPIQIQIRTLILSEDYDNQLDVRWCATCPYIFAWQNPSFPYSLKKIYLPILCCFHCLRFHRFPWSKKALSALSENLLFLVTCCT